MSKFSKQQAIDFCEKCYVKDNDCIFHNKIEVDNETLYPSVGCQHGGLVASKYHCDVCTDVDPLPKGFTAIKTSQDGKDKSPPSQKKTVKPKTKDNKLPDGNVDCSDYHSDVSDCIKHKECNYCQMPSESGKDMKCISDNMKDKLEMAEVVDEHSCVNKNYFDSNNVNKIDAAGVNSTNYSPYYKYTVPTYKEKQAENETDEEEVGEKQIRRKQNESKKTNNNDKPDFFFIGEDPRVNENVKYHYDKGYFFDNYTEHGLEFNEDQTLQEYDEEVFEKQNSEPDTVVDRLQGDVNKDADDKVITQEIVEPTKPTNIKSIVQLQNTIRNMDSTSKLLTYGLVGIFVVMVLLFVFLLLKK
tara:strand:- start:141 stop:1211 length:1071 start_codon:yes stop_codon:yes gene_type:complete